MTQTLIIGGTGKTGRRVARRLAEAGRPVRAVSRADGFDVGNPDTWAAALDGVTAAYLVVPSLLAGAHVPRLVERAVEAGARRLVLLSAPLAHDEAHPLYPAERAVRDSGAAWTVLRPVWFAQNFSEGEWAGAVRAGTLALPVGEGRTAFVDAEDIADVAVAALTGDRHTGEVYTLTGPRAIGFGEAADLIAKAAGHPVGFTDVPAAAYTERLAGHGVAPQAAAFLARLYGDLRDDRTAYLGDGVHRALGREPRRFEDYVARTAAEGRWT